jgi:diguanylate cyclase (GGDEF)-like protein/PAS domain S-box-containing protein
MSLKKLFRILLGIQFALGIGLAILTVSLFLNQEKLSQSQDVHFQSYLLADELRQSSDDLTRLARTYVATGNEKHEREYWAVLDIRNGKSPRPVDYNRIYWDFISGTGQKPRPDGATISLRELMIKEGFTNAELEKLTLSQKYSDELVKTEKIAMNAAKGLFDDGAGNFTVKKEPDRALAIRLMNDEAYHQHKVNIMKPIDEFYAMFAERTSGDVAKYEQRSMNLLQSLGVLIIVIMGMFGYSFVIIQRQITEREWAEKELRRNQDITERLAQEIAVIAEIGKVVGSTLDIEEVYERFAAEVRKLITFDRIAVNLHDLDQDIVSTVYASGEYIAGRQPGDAFPLKGSVSEVVVRTRAGMFSHPLSVEEMDKQFPNHSATIQAGMRSLLCVPLISRDEVIASLHFRSKMPNAYTEQDLRLAERIGEQIAGTIASAQLYAGRKKTEMSLRESEERYRTLVENASDIVFRLDATGHVTFVNPAALRIIGYEEKELIGKHYATLIRPDMQEAAVKFFGHQFVKGILNTYSEYPVIMKDGREIWLGQNTQLIFRDGKVIAFQAVARDITDRKLVEKALKDSEEKYRELSIIDDLTQLYNSRHFYFQLKNETERSNRYEQPLTLLLLDLDNFKAFNDAYGHVEGDQVLSRLGQVVKKCLRETDFAYRYGGEEFTILLPMTTNADGAVTAERIRTEFKKETFSSVPGQDVHVTVSIGLAQYKPQEEMKAFVHRVDQLMYQGKKNGKDRVCSEPSPQEEFKW